MIGGIGNPLPVDMDRTWPVAQIGQEISTSPQPGGFYRDRPLILDHVSRPSLGVPEPALQVTGSAALLQKIYMDRMYRRKVSWRMAQAHYGKSPGPRMPHTISRRDYFRAGSDEWFREAIYTSVRALRGLLACREIFARSLGITGSQFAVLMGVAYRQGAEGVSIGDLARHVALGSTHATTEVGRLIALGYLTKRPNPRDGRSVLVSLSPKGESAVIAVTPVVRAANDILFQDVDAPAIAAMAQAMSKVGARCEQAVAELGWRAKYDQPIPVTKLDGRRRHAPARPSAKGTRGA